MTGKNKLILNCATMCEAIKCWLDREIMQNDTNVTHVSYNDADFTFNVILEEKTAV